MYTLDFVNMVQDVINGADKNINIDKFGTLIVNGCSNPSDFDGWLEGFTRYIKSKFPQADKELVKECLLELGVKNSNGKFRMNSYKAIFEYKNGGIATWESKNITADKFIKDLLSRPNKGEYINKFIEIYQKNNTGSVYSESKLSVRKYNNELRPLIK